MTRPWQQRRARQPRGGATSARLAKLDAKQPKLDRVMKDARILSLPKSVALAGGRGAWNSGHPQLRQMLKLLDAMCTATTVQAALEEVRTIMSLGHQLWAYAYMRNLYNKNLDLYYATILAEPVCAPWP